MGNSLDVTVLKDPRYESLFKPYWRLTDSRCLLPSVIIQFTELEDGVRNVCYKEEWILPRLVLNRWESFNISSFPFITSAFRQYQTGHLFPHNHLIVPQLVFDKI